MEQWDCGCPCQLPWLWCLPLGFCRRRPLAPQYKGSFGYGSANCVCTAREWGGKLHFCLSVFLCDVFSMIYRKQRRSNQACLSTGLTCRQRPLTLTLSRSSRHALDCQCGYQSLNSNSRQLASQPFSREEPIVRTGWLAACTRVPFQSVTLRYGALNWLLRNGTLMWESRYMEYLISSDEISVVFKDYDQDRSRQPGSVFLASVIRDNW